MLSRSLGQLDSVTRGWLMVAGGSLARLSLGFIASVVIARTLGPEAFGTFAVLAAVASFAGAGVDLGLTNAAVRRVSGAWPADLTRVSEIWRGFLWLRLLVVGAVVVPGVALSSPLSRLLFGDPENAIYVQLALLGVAATALSGSFTSMLQATGRFGRLSSVLITNSGLTALLAVALAATGRLTIGSVLLVLGIGTSLASLLLAYWLLPGAWTVRPPSRADFLVVGKDLSRYGAWLWIGSLFTILALYLDVLIVNHWLTAATVGIYALAVNLIVKVDVVNQSLYTVLLPTASALRSRSEIRDYLRLGLIRSGVIAVALLPLILLARPLINLFYGSAYTEAATIFQALLLVAMLNVMLMPLLLLAFTFDRPRLVALAEGGKVLTLLFVGLILVPQLGTTGAVIAKLSAAVVGGSIVLGFVYRVVLPFEDLPIESQQSFDGT